MVRQVEQKAHESNPFQDKKVVLKRIYGNCMLIESYTCACAHVCPSEILEQLKRTDKITSEHSTAYVAHDFEQ